MANAEMQVAHTEMRMAHLDMQTANAEMQMAHMEMRMAHLDMQTVHLEMQMSHPEMQMVDAEMQVSQTPAYCICRIDPTGSEPRRRGCGRECSPGVSCLSSMSCSPVSAAYLRLVRTQAVEPFSTASYTPAGCGVRSGAPAVQSREPPARMRPGRRSPTCWRHIA